MADTPDIIEVKDAKCPFCGGVSHTPQCMSVFEKGRRSISAATQTCEAAGMVVVERDLNYLGSFCPECGPNVTVDEDGLCVGCGCTAIGTGVDRMIKDIAALKSRADILLKESEVLGRAAQDWKARAEKAEAEADELNLTLDLINSKILGADKIWQEATGITNVSPDFGCLIQWFMKEREALKSALAAYKTGEPSEEQVKRIAALLAVMTHPKFFKDKSNEEIWIMLSDEAKAEAFTFACAVGVVLACPPSGVAWVNCTFVGEPPPIYPNWFTGFTCSKVHAGVTIFATNGEYVAVKREALSAFEWVEINGDLECPECEAPKSFGIHAPDCWLGLALKGGK